MRLSSLSTNLIIEDIPCESAGEGCLTQRIDHVTFKASQVLDKENTGAAHCKRRSGKSVRLEHIRSNHGQARDVGSEPLGAGRVVDMLAADVRSRCRDTAITDRQHFH